MIENSASTLKNSNHISSQFKRKRWTAAKWGSYPRIKGNISTVLIYCPVGVSLRLTRLKIKNPSSKVSFNFSLLKSWKPIQIKKKNNTRAINICQLNKTWKNHRHTEILYNYLLNEWMMIDWMNDWLNKWMQDQCGPQFLNSEVKYVSYMPTDSSQ